MPVLFANPWGLLALLGIPVILAVHFLHRHRKVIPVSTLFLIEIAREPAQSGRRLHRLLPSIPMWLQLLLVLLIAGLLARPYRPQGVLQVAIVVDDSASMMAFRSELAGRLNSLHQNLKQGGQKTQWHIYSANPSSPMIYSGEEPEPWLDSLNRWEPSESWRDPTDSLRLARNRVSTNGVVIYATDTPAESLPSGVAQLSVGSPIDNVGIAGVNTQSTEEGSRWQAVVVNHSNQPVNRQWSLEWNGTNATPVEVLTLQPRAMVTLEGLLPEEATRLVLKIEGDRFPLDDFCPIVRQAPKPLRMAAIGDAAPPWLTERLPRAIPRLSFTAPAAADFALVGLTADTQAPPVAGIHFSTAGKRNAPFLNQLATPTSHPLVEGLAWSGLTVQDVPAPEPLEGDEVLLWSGERPLISLRHSVVKPSPNENPEAPAANPPSPPAGPQLILHFNPAHSNFERLPAGAILLLRYAESIRATKSATTWAQVEPGQNLRPLLNGQIEDNNILELLDIQGNPLNSRELTRMAKAPKIPGFIRVRDENTVRLEAAVAFADARESDFLGCRPLDTTEQAIAKAIRASIPTENAMLPLLSLAAIASLLALYHFQSGSARPSSEQEDKPETRPSVA